MTTNDPALLQVEGPVTPVLIHRAVLGSVERIMALLIEHYNGRWPYWLNPRQVIIVTTNDSREVVDYANKVKRILQGSSRSWTGAALAGDKISVDIDSTPRSMKKKVSEAKRKRYAVVVAVGNQDIPLERVVADLSGIPDPQGLLLCSGILRQVSAQKALFSTTDLQGSGKSQTADSKDLPLLSPGEIKRLEINPGWLKKFLDGLQKVYFYDDQHKPSEYSVMKE